MAEFTFEALPGAGEPFDSSGVLYWLGTSRGTAPYENPHHSGAVTCKWSSIGAERLSLGNIVSHTPSYAWTKNSQHSWMQVDLGEGLRLRPNYYCYRGCSQDATTQPPRNWELQGSTDEETWTVLRSHVDDEAIRVGSAAESSAWDVKAKEAYRYLRIQQVGPNGSRQHYLACGGIEFYGTLFEAGIIVCLRLASDGEEPQALEDPGGETVVCTNFAGEVVAELPEEYMQRAAADARVALADILDVPANSVQLILPGGCHVGVADEEATLLELLSRALIPPEAAAPPSPPATPGSGDREMREGEALESREAEEDGQ